MAMARTLRTALRTQGALPIDLALQVGWQVVQAARELHARGVVFLMHPSNVVLNADQSVQIDVALAMTDAHDAACISPENITGAPSADPRASVYASGALLYEMFTGMPIAPGAAPARMVRPDLPRALDALMNAALTRDVSARPADLASLASALEGVLSTLEPPPADDDFGIDVSMAGASGPPPAAGSSAGYMDTGDALGDIKARMDADPVARFVISKDHMDHGPFRGAELLQQIAAGQFGPADDLRDETSGKRAPIGQWPDFAPFTQVAEVAKLARVEREQVAVLDATEAQGNKRTQLYGGVGLVLLVLGVVVWQVKARDAAQKRAELAESGNVDIEVSGGLKGKPKPVGGAGGGGGGFASGMSYEAALNVAEDMSANAGARDLSDGDLGAPLSNGAYVLGCGASHGSVVKVHVAVRNGRAMGVSAEVKPPNAAVASCVERHVRGLSWPSTSKRFGAHTTYNP